MEHTDQTPFSADESFRVIGEMIANAKQSYKQNSFFFLLWGWLLFFTGITVFVLSYYMPQYAGYPWFIQGIVGGIISMAYSWNNRRKVQTSELVNSPVNKTIIMIWLAFGITLFCTLFASGFYETDPTPIVLIVTAFPTFLSGKVLRFRPLVTGGFCFWALGIFALFVPYPLRTLIFSLAILIGYLVPGYLLRHQEKQKIGVQRS